MSEEHELLHELFEAADSGLAVVDAQLRVIMLNRVVVGLVGVQSGVHIDDAIPLLAPTLGRALRALFDTEQTVSGVEMRGKDAGHFAASAWPLKKGGRVVAAAVRFVDVTVRRERDLELLSAEARQRHLVDNVTTFLHRLIGGEITLTLDLHPEVDVVRVDWAQLEQVLVNLTLNARDAMPGGGTLTIRTDNVQLDAPLDGLVPAGAWVVLSVRDTGRGIPDADRAHIFEPFFSTKPGAEGTGLGLASCYGIIKQHGGHVTVDSAVGAGTTFTLYFPRAGPP